MLITAKHLLVLLLLMALAFTSGFGAAWLVDPAGGVLGVTAGVIAAILVPLLVAWPVFRALSLRPLILPICPHCGRRHHNYHIPRDAWPAAVVICGNCNQPLRLSFGALDTDVHGSRFGGDVLPGSPVAGSRDEVL